MCVLWVGPPRDGLLRGLEATRPARECAFPRVHLHASTPTRCLATCTVTSALSHLHDQEPLTTASDVAPLQPHHCCPDALGQPPPGQVGLVGLDCCGPSYLCAVNLSELSRFNVYTSGCVLAFPEDSEDLGLLRMEDHWPLR